ncbi:hypothetical protein J437_LFUL005028 [Ladona fulva]|uniref:PiggyBac transposable element-derived protein domain-containing protein n=1 Tax=Ladona fulva TaxID=123851 RepID=A0A8K0JVU6_LADFU|nr:hypothetical protein J437_LFUL005028 [Ladona fulva]
MEVYAGKQPGRSYCVSNKPLDVVKRIEAPLFGSCHNISTDNWFTDFNFIDELKTKKLSNVGTVRKNKRQLPFLFVNVKGRAQYSSMFGFHDGMVLASYPLCKGKNIIFASSLLSDDNINPGSGFKQKPEVITFHNSTKSCVDTADQMCAICSVDHNKVLANRNLLCHAKSGGHQFSSYLP